MAMLEITVNNNSKNVKLNEQELIELGTDSQKWMIDAEKASAELKYLKVHPHFLIALLKSCKTAEYEKNELKENIEKLKKVVDFLNNLKD